MCYFSLLWKIADQKNLLFGVDESYIGLDHKQVVFASFPAPKCESVGRSAGRHLKSSEKCALDIGGRAVLNIIGKPRSEPDGTNR